MHSLELGRARSSNPKIDKSIILPLLACAYAVIISPLLIYFTSAQGGRGSLQALMEEHPENKYFWTALAAISVVAAARNGSRLRTLTLPPHLACLLAYLAFAGMSVLWAFKPEISFIRFVAQAMIITSIVLPAMSAARTTDMMRGLFLCYAFAVVLNVFFVLNQAPNMVENVAIGYPGYFTFKGILGECASIALLLSLHELLYPGRRRLLGLIVIIIATWLIFVSESKGSLGFALIAPALAAFTLVVAKGRRISPATVLVSMLAIYVVVSTAIGFTVNKLSWYVYGNYTFSGRTFIWDFVNYMIDRKPLFGWGYQSFWLVGPDGPSLEAGGWVRQMPSAHSGYLDTRLETGYLGFALFVIFIVATLHAVGRMAERERARAWLLLSLALFVILTNFLETTWMRGMEPLWVVFVIVAAEIGRFWQPFRPGDAASEIRGAPKPRRLSLRDSRLALGTDSHHQDPQ